MAFVGVPGTPGTSANANPFSSALNTIAGGAAVVALGPTAVSPTLKNFETALANPGQSLGAFIGNFLGSNSNAANQAAANIVQGNTGFFSSIGTALGFGKFSDAGISDAEKGTTEKGTSTGLGDEISQLFLRGVIIILGFIFTAVALTMFKSPEIITSTAQGFKKVGGSIKGAIKK